MKARRSSAAKYSRLFGVPPKRDIAGLRGKPKFNDHSVSS